MAKDDDHSWSDDGGMSSDDGGRLYDTGAVEQEKAEEEAVEKLTRRETRGVRFWRIFTMLTLIAVSIAVSTVTYRLLEDQDIDEFEGSVSLRLAM